MLLLLVQVTERHQSMSEQLVPRVDSVTNHLESVIEYVKEDLQLAAMAFAEDVVNAGVVNVESLQRKTKNYREFNARVTELIGLWTAINRTDTEINPVIPFKEITPQEMSERLEVVKYFGGGSISAPGGGTTIVLAEFAPIIPEATTVEDLFKPQVEKPKTPQMPAKFRPVFSNDFMQVSPWQVRLDILEYLLYERGSSGGSLTQITERVILKAIGKNVVDSYRDPLFKSLTDFTKDTLAEWVKQEIIREYGKIYFVSTGSKKYTGTIKMMMKRERLELRPHPTVEPVSIGK